MMKCIRFLGVATAFAVAIFAVVSMFGCDTLVIVPECPACEGEECPPVEVEPDPEPEPEPEPELLCCLFVMIPDEGEPYTLIAWDTECPSEDQTLDDWICALDREDSASESEVEICDGVDNDGDGVVDEGCGCITERLLRDADGDGYGNPYDHYVSVCVGNELPEGYVNWIDGRDDCDDADPDVHPGAIDLINGIDDDCDGDVDEDAGGYM